MKIFTNITNENFYKITGWIIILILLLYGLFKEHPNATISIDSREFSDQGLLREDSFQNRGMVYPLTMNEKIYLKNE